MLDLPRARYVSAGGGHESPVMRYRSLSDEIAPLGQVKMLAGIDDVTESLHRPPQLVIGGVERDGGEAEDVRGAEVGDDAARLERPRDARRLIVLDCEVPTAPLRLAWGTNGEGVWRGGEPGLFQ